MIFRPLLLSAVLTTGFCVQAQLVVNNAPTPQQLVQTVLLGGGVTASNITFNGQPWNIQSEQMGTITASHITNWVNTHAKEAQTNLPRWIRRLCFDAEATRQLAFPARDSGFVPGRMEFCPVNAVTRGYPQARLDGKSAVTKT